MTKKLLIHLKITKKNLKMIKGEDMIKGKEPKKITNSFNIDSHSIFL